MSEPGAKLNKDDFYDLRTVRTVEFAMDDSDENEAGVLIMTIHETTYGKPKPKPTDPTAGVAEEPPL